MLHPEHSSQCGQADCANQQPARQNTRELGGESSESEAVLKDHHRRESEQRAEDGARPAVDCCAPEHDSRDRGQLVARAGIGLGLAKMGDVDDSREAGGESRQHVQLRDVSRDVDAGEARRVLVVPDGEVHAAASRAVDEEPGADGCEDKHWCLNRHRAEKALSQRQEM